MNRAEYKIHRVISLSNITPTVFILRFERKCLVFSAGQHVNVGIHGSGYTREYSVYSGVDEPFLEILVKEVIDGWVSPKLRELKEGDELMVEAALGYFGLADAGAKKQLFVATGTGVAPYHCFLQSFPDIDYHLLHGVTELAEGCDREYYGDKLTLCTSRKDDGDYYGRVTRWLEEHDLSPYKHIYLCGNRKMINEAYQILEAKGMDYRNIHAEAYF